MPKSKKSPKENSKATLIITEKPQAAAKIAAALSNGTDEKKTDKNKVSYYEFTKDGRRILIGCAVGHLYGIAQIAARGPFPNFEVEWRPNSEKKNSGYTKKYVDVLKKLAKQSSEFVVATDYDVEGEVIGWNVVRFLVGKGQDKKAKRMKFSSLTKDELENSWGDLQEHLNWGEAYAGETRHYLDWFYGINLSRGLMKALSNAGRFRILSIGRVQGPALKIVYDKEKTIQNFKAEPFWQVFLQVQDIKKQKVEVKFPKDLTKKSELLKFQQLKGKRGTATTEVKEEKIEPPTPFDLTTLQTESYRFNGLTPSQTMSAAQNLYLEGLISYPRTSSQEYPEAIGYDKILKTLGKQTTLVKYAVNKKPTKGKKTDPAHPAIYPTGEVKKLSGSEKKVYDLIMKRFIACFCSVAITENKRISVDVNGLVFHKNGMQIKEKNWLNVYPSNVKEEKIPTINGEVDVSELRIEEKMTTPPRRYSAASLVRELEKKNLGTKATRASIVETLYNRGYIREKSIEVTQLGMTIVKTLEKYSPIIIDEELTREIEKEMESVSEAKKDWEKKEEKVLKIAKDSITEIAQCMTKHLEAIGKSLAEGNEEAIEEQRKENTLSECPVCHKGNLRVMYGKKYHRYFVSCDAYPECKTTFSLPPKGMMKPARAKDKETGEEKLEMCPECGFPLIISLKKGSRPWKFCFNPECPSRKRAEEAKKEKLRNSEEKV